MATSWSFETILIELELSAKISHPYWENRFFGKIPNKIR